LQDVQCVSPAGIRSFFHDFELMGGVRFDCNWVRSGTFFRQKNFMNLSRRATPPSGTMFQLEELGGKSQHRPISVTLGVTFPSFSGLVVRALVA
jgi:hypothetical protein